VAASDRYMSPRPPWARCRSGARQRYAGRRRRGSHLRDERTAIRGWGGDAIGRMVAERDDLSRIIPRPDPEAWM